jgi:allene oxide cyclase
MRALLVPIVSCVFVSLAYVAVAAVPAQGARVRVSSTMTTVHVVEHALTDTVIHAGKSNDALGDQLVFGNPVYDRANRRRVASDQGHCVRTVVGKSWECFWTVILAGGQITVEGPYDDAGDSVLAITGGTGLYNGARGEMGLHARNARGTEYDFVYRLNAAG